MIAAVNALKKAGWIVESFNGGWLAERKGQYFFYDKKPKNDRQLIKLAKEVLKNFTTKDVKEFTSRPHRRKVNQNIKSENFESISGERRYSKNNPWNFD